MNLDYSRIYSNWHNNSEDHRYDMIKYNVNLLSPFLPENKNARILELGCGMGFAMEALKELGYSNVSGIEIDEGQYQVCLKKKLNVLLVKETDEFFRSNSKTFDFVIAIDVLEHIPNENLFPLLCSINKSLKNGGKLLGRVPNASSSLSSHWRYLDYTHHATFTIYSLDFLLHSSGFSKIRIEANEFFNPGLPLRSYFSFYFLKRSFWTHLYRSICFRLVRLWQRTVLYAELGNDEARKIPLSLNIIAFAEKSD